MEADAGICPWHHVAAPARLIGDRYAASDRVDFRLMPWILKM